MTNEKPVEDKLRTVRDEGSPPKGAFGYTLTLALDLLQEVTSSDAHLYSRTLPSGTPCTVHGDRERERVGYQLI